MKDVFLQAGRAGWEHFLPVEELAAVAPSVKDWEAQIVGEGGARVLIAEDEGGLFLGFAVIRPSQDADSHPKIGELDTFYVRPSAWGTGAARRLMTAALARLHEAGFREATLWTAEQNRRAASAYASSGWRADGRKRHKTFLGVTFEEERYRIALAAP